MFPEPLPHSLTQETPNTHPGLIHTHLPEHTQVRVFPDDDTWLNIYSFLEKEGRNTTGQWNDTCGILMDDGSNTLEFGCGDGGKLLTCTCCHTAFHFECCGLGDQRNKAPVGNWVCPSCVSHAHTQLETPVIVHNGKPKDLKQAIDYCVKHNIDYGKARTYNGFIRKLRAVGHTW